MTEKTEIRDYSTEKPDSTTTEWATPRSIWRPIADRVGGFDTDPASGCEPEAIASTRYTKENDGLSQSWFGNVWLNPPYTHWDKWLRKAISEVYKGDADLVVMLCPARINRIWFQEQLDSIDKVCFLKGKVEFLKNGEEQLSGMPTAMMIITIGDTPDSLVDWMLEQGWVIDAAGNACGSPTTDKFCSFCRNHYDEDYLANY